MSSPGYDHLGLLQDTREEVDDLLAACKRYRDEDDRVQIQEYEDLVYPGLTVHAFYVKYLLPIYFDVQSMERTRGRDAMPVRGTRSGRRFPGGRSHISVRLVRAAGRSAEAARRLAELLAHLVTESGDDADHENGDEGEDEHVLDHRRTALGVDVKTSLEPSLENEKIHVRLTPCGQIETGPEPCGVQNRRLGCCWQLPRQLRGSA